MMGADCKPLIGYARNCDYARSLTLGSSPCVQGEAGEGVREKSSMLSAGLPKPQNPRPYWLSDHTRKLFDAASAATRNRSIC